MRRRARSFISEDRVILPGEMYLIRASGTRKGSGSFYTKPQLAVPTVHRTLEPLAYDITGEGADRVLTPKKPEEILALKVCDPAMGSASFLVAALGSSLMPCMKVSGITTGFPKLIRNEKH